jgi:hypothetical protein
MIALLGPAPSDLLARGKQSSRFFSKEGMEKHKWLYSASHCKIAD